MKHNAMAIHVRTRIIYSALAIMTIMCSMGKDLMAQTNSTSMFLGVFIGRSPFLYLLIHVPAWLPNKAF
jgi:hypothetical protein